jgi:hypothetical protein
LPARRFRPNSQEPAPSPQSGRALLLVDKPQGLGARVGRMSVMNRRNAIAGWAFWELAKAAMRRKVAPPPPPLYRRVLTRPESAAVLLAAAGVGVAAYFRLRSDDGE